MADSLTIAAASPRGAVTIARARGATGPTIYNTFGASTLLGNQVSGFQAAADDLDQRFSALEQQ